MICNHRSNSNETPPTDLQSDSAIIPASSQQAFVMAQGTRQVALHPDAWARSRMALSLINPKSRNGILNSSNPCT